MNAENAIWLFRECTINYRLPATLLFDGNTYALHLGILSELNQRTIEAMVSSLANVRLIKEHRMWVIK